MVVFERFEDLPAWQAAADLYGFAESLLEQPDLGASAGWRDQFDRAALSISTYVARGVERGTPAEKFMAVRDARAAVGEVRSMLRVLERRKIPREAQVPVARMKALADSCSSQLRTYADSLQEPSAPAAPPIVARPPELRPPQAPSAQSSPDFRKRTVEVARKILGILPHQGSRKVQGPRFKAQYDDSEFPRGICRKLPV